MSFLEESNGEEYNDEQVHKVIQSLEAEINHEQNMLEGQDLSMKLFSDQEDSQNCLASMDFGRVDEMELVASSPSDHDMNWSYYMDQCGGLELDDLVEHEIVSCGYFHISNIVYETDQKHGLSSLWHERCDAVLAYN
ncbi:hypothetical protein CUMW_213260 [Citrus unshiu]|uniref:Uncharacterized protein n=1 Tax=Citrus unshiu TaxID=55188 RepID=A0A2H5QBC1_CITUN|nr:hypothetical protein CUMW_213260 [Citrus unshiu]